MCKEKSLAEVKNKSDTILGESTCGDKVENKFRFRDIDNMKVSAVCSDDTFKIHHFKIVVIRDGEAGKSQKR
jgi:hypothetical protein